MITTKVENQGDFAIKKTTDSVYFAHVFLGGSWSESKLHPNKWAWKPLAAATE